MFFPERVKSVQPHDRILEVGPGSMPHPFSQVFLDKQFPDAQAFDQRGRLAAIGLNKPVVYYDGGTFPFRDHEFDYVICSHVLEHVEDVKFFVAELTRVASRGYLEFPTVYYEYLYNFDEHLNLLRYQDDGILWMPKSQTCLKDFGPIQGFLRTTLQAGYDQLVQSLKESFFHGFEWTASIDLHRTNDLAELVPPTANVPPRWEAEKPPSSGELIRELGRRFRKRMNRLTSS
jgi:hypothetical protein